MNKALSTIAVGPRAARQFGLSSLMLIMLWLALGLALARLALPAGLFYAAATLPTLLRTVRVISHHKAAGQAVSHRTLAATFLLSLKMVGLLTITTVAAVCVMFAAACFWGLVVAAQGSRSMARAFFSLGRLLQRFARRAASATRTLFATAVRGCRRPLWLVIAPYRMTILAGSLMSAVALAAMVVAVWLLQIAFDGFSRLERWLRFARDGGLAWTRLLAAADRRLLRAYGAAP
jgi:hypothetical protein